MFDFRFPDGGLFLPPQCALLETILEEEDECEESDSCSDDCSSGEDEEESCSSSGSPGNDGNHSDWGGWGGSSASDAQSVIHIEPEGDTSLTLDGNKTYLLYLNIF